MKKNITRVLLASLIFATVGCNQPKPGNVAATPSPPAPGQPADTQVQGEEVAVLTHAPEVPPPITRKHPTKVIVKMEVKELKSRLADGVEYTFWTFGGQVPGEFIRIRQGDEVELHLQNHPSSKMPHNIDMHAVTGPGGGATSSFTAPGHESVFSFKALNPGLFVYHCATAPVGMHIANGMYGLILVEPPEGLPKVDHEYYVMQGEFYTEGKNGQPGLQPFSMEKALDETPDYVVFNGSVGALVGDHALSAKVGETVRLFVGNGGPNLISSFHVIGEIFDNVYQESGTKVTHNVQTTLVPAGGSVMVDFKVDVPGTYIMVDHSIFRAFNKGALGMLKVDGPENKLIYSGTQETKVYQPEGSTIQTIPDQKAPSAPLAQNKEEQIKMGSVIFKRNCAACHQPDGRGVKGAFPPLAKSDFITTPKVAAKIVANGLTGVVTVNGNKYNGVMPALGLSNEDVANVVTYVVNSWENKGGQVSPEEVAQLRK